MEKETIIRPLGKIAGYIGNFFVCLSCSVEESEYLNPLDSPLEAVTDWPGQPTHEHLCHIGKVEEQ
jgi:hypothetical protein